MSMIKKLVVIILAPLLTTKMLFVSWYQRRASVRYFQETAKYPLYLHEGNAASFCLFHAQRYCVGNGVDVGAGKWVFPGAKPIEDNEQENALNIREKTSSLDFVFSSHCLEHIKEWEKALEEWCRVLKNGGILYLYLPHPACRMWNKDILQYHLWEPNPNILVEKLTALMMEVVDVSYFPDSYLSFYIVAQKKG